MILLMSEKRNWFVGLPFSKLRFKIGHRSSQLRINSKGEEYSSAGTNDPFIDIWFKDNELVLWIPEKKI